jgi:flagellar biosynthetic protein FlhB
VADDGDKTEAATPRRLQKARDGGNIPISREITTMVSLAALTIVMSSMAAGLSTRLVGRLAVFLSQLSRIDMSDHGIAAMRMAVLDAAYASMPVMLLAGAAGVAAMSLQTRFLLNTSRLVPDLSRLNPTRGLKRIFGMTNVIELGKSVLKLIVAGAICWHVLHAGLPALSQAPSWDAGTMLVRMAQQIMQVLLAVLALQATIAIGDISWVRYRYARDNRMSRFDVRQEQKDMDGDPRIKRRLRQIRMMRARKRMRDGVKRATVVITNPTHYAVALRYDKTEGNAPVVVAKGADSMAARIREAAGDFGVPLVANPPLARALYRVEIDAQIPAEHYRAVAEVIAYVWRLRHRAARAA